MNVRAVDFVYVGVPSIDEGVRFYSGLFGRSPTTELKGWAEFDLGPVTLALFAPPWNEHADPPARSWDNWVVALAVEDISQAVAELRSRGIPVLGEVMELGTCYWVDVEDPFGNRITLHQRKDGTAG